MINRIMTPLLVAVALAASTSITAAPAAAEIGPRHSIHQNHHGHGIGSVSLLKKKRAFSRSQFRGHHNRGYGSVRYRSNAYGQSAFEVNKLKHEALSSCSVQLRHDAQSSGYKGARLTGADVQQVDKDKFVIHAGAKLFDGYKLNHESYTCTVTHGKVVDAFKPKKLNL